MTWARKSAVSACAAALTALALVSPVEASNGAPTGHTGDGVGARPVPHPTIHSSDGARGPSLSVSPPRSRLAAAPLDEVGWQVAPGLNYSQWTQIEAQGPARVFVLTARLDQPGLVLDQVSGSTVPARAPLSQWLRDDGAVAGVNADFFDINDTGAPLGVGVDRQRSTLHAPRSGWNTTFLIDSRGAARVVQDALVGKVVRAGRTVVTLNNFNSPTVAPGGIGDYTPAWGRASGSRVVDNATVVREVNVLGGVVRSNRTTLTSGPVINGDLLVGRGAGAQTLRGLRVGQRVQVQRALSVPARVAVGGSAQLLRNGQTTVTDTVELHPRTAIGIDRDGGLLHLVVVDGRSQTSKGMTLVQLAQLLRSLGDEEALNLDGGGSSTMIAGDPVGSVGVRNQPSDGQERPVPNGLGFRYLPPSG